jgi:hypothetical protein
MGPLACRKLEERARPGVGVRSGNGARVGPLRLGVRRSWRQAPEAGMGGGWKDATCVSQGLGGRC